MKWGWVLAGIVLWWIIVDPNGASAAVHNIGHFLASIKP